MCNAYPVEHSSRRLRYQSTDTHASIYTDQESELPECHVRQSLLDFREANVSRALNSYLLLVFPTLGEIRSQKLKAAFSLDIRLSTQIPGEFACHGIFGPSPSTDAHKS